MAHYGLIEVSFPVFEQESEWLRYDAVDPYSECPGARSDDDWHSTSLAYAEELLDMYLPYIVHDQYLRYMLREGPIDVRVRVFESADCEGSAAAVVEATWEQMAPLLLRAAGRAAREVHADLRTLVASASNAGMTLATLVREVHGELDEEAVLGILQAHAHREPGACGHRSLGRGDGLRVHGHDCRARAEDAGVGEDPLDANGGGERDPLLGLRP